MRLAKLRSYSSGKLSKVLDVLIEKQFDFGEDQIGHLRPQIRDVTPMSPPFCLPVLCEISLFEFVEDTLGQQTNAIEVGWNDAG